MAIGKFPSASRGDASHEEMNMCPDCKARRQMARTALLNAAYGQGAAHLLKGAAEALGLKEKTGAAEAEEKAQPKPLALSKPKQKTK